MQNKMADIEEKGETSSLDVSREDRRRRRHHSDSDSNHSYSDETLDTTRDSLNETKDTVTSVSDGEEFESANEETDGSESDTEENTAEEESEEGDDVIQEGEDVSVDEERGSGDGQEQPNEEADNLDDDEDRKNPAFIPKMGAYYEHDRRTGDVDDDNKQDDDKREQKKLWSDDHKKWQHDMYNEAQQAPKSQEELFSMYGYDIKLADAPPDIPPKFQQGPRLPRTQQRQQMGDFVDNKFDSGTRRGGYQDRRKYSDMSGQGRGQYNDRGQGGSGQYNSDRRDIKPPGGSPPRQFQNSNRYNKPRYENYSNGDGNRDRNNYNNRDRGNYRNNDNRGFRAGRGDYQRPPDQADRYRQSSNRGRYDRGDRYVSDNRNYGDRVDNQNNPSRNENTGRAIKPQASQDARLSYNTETLRQHKNESPATIVKTGQHEKDTKTEFPPAPKLDSVTGRPKRYSSQRQRNVPSPPPPGSVPVVSGSGDQQRIFYKTGPPPGFRGPAPQIAVQQTFQAQQTALPMQVQQPLPYAVQGTQITSPPQPAMSVIPRLPVSMATPRQPLVPPAAYSSMINYPAPPPHYQMTGHLPLGAFPTPPPVVPQPGGQSAVYQAGGITYFASPEQTPAPPTTGTPPGGTTYYNTEAPTPAPPGGTTYYNTELQSTTVPSNIIYYSPEAQQNVSPVRPPTSRRPKAAIPIVNPGENPLNASYEQGSYEQDDSLDEDYVVDHMTSELPLDVPSEPSEAALKEASQDTVVIQSDSSTKQDSETVRKDTGEENDQVVDKA